MSIYKMSEQTKSNLSDYIGLPFERLVELSPEEELELAAKKYGRKIGFSKVRSCRRAGMGNPLLARKKIRTLQEVEKKNSEGEIIEQTWRNKRHNTKWSCYPFTKRY